MFDMTCWFETIMQIISQQQQATLAKDNRVLNDQLRVYLQADVDI